MIDPAPSNQAVLSHPPGEHLQNLFHSDLASFDEADDHADIFDNRPGPRQRCRVRWRWRDTFTTLGVLLALLLLANLVLVVRGAAAVRLRFAMGLLASEGATQITPPRIAGLREKKDPAVPTARQAPAQLRLGPQDRPEHHVIREDQSGNQTDPIPVRRESKMLLDLDC